MLRRRPFLAHTPGLIFHGAVQHLVVVLQLRGVGDIVEVIAVVPVAVVRFREECQARFRRRQFADGPVQFHCHVRLYRSQFQSGMIEIRFHRNDVR